MYKLGKRMKLLSSCKKNSLKRRRQNAMTTTKLYQLLAYNLITQSRKKKDYKRNFKLLKRY